MKIVVFNVRYSENLGDGLLSDCMCRALTNNGFEVEVLDLAGRTTVGTSSRRGLILKLLKILPPFLRRAIVVTVLSNALAGSRAHWREKIDRADGIILGGGNLFQDDDLNFPLKVGAVLELAASLGKPLSIFAVGVTPNWSRKGRSLFGRYQDANLHHLSFRDRLAQENWRSHFNGAPQGEITPDPGILAGSLYERSNAGHSETIGLCITAPDVLTRHATQLPETIPFATLPKIVDLVRHLAARGLKINLFTNGAREDYRFAESILTECRMSSVADTDTLTLLDRPTTVAELVETVSRNSVVIAHRLHACICAHSLGIPTIGLAWDIKVRGFFESVHRADFCIPDASLDASSVVKLVQLSEEQGVDRQTLAAQQDHLTKSLLRAVNFTKVEVTGQSEAPQARKQPVWKKALPVAGSHL